MTVVCCHEGVMWKIVLVSAVPLPDAASLRRAVD